MLMVEVMVVFVVVGWMVCVVGYMVRMLVELV